MRAFTVSRWGTSARVGTVQLERRAMEIGDGPAKRKFFLGQMEPGSRSKRCANYTPAPPCITPPRLITYFTGTSLCLLSGTLLNARVAFRPSSERR